MAVPTLYQTVLASNTTVPHTSTVATWDSTPTNGRTMHLWFLARGVIDVAYTLPAGWTLREDEYSVNSGAKVVYATRVASGEGATVTVTHESKNNTMLILSETSGVYGGSTPGRQFSGTSVPFEAVTPDSGTDVLLFAVSNTRLTYDVLTAPSGYTQQENNANDFRGILYSKGITGASGSYSATLTFASWVQAGTVHAFVAGSAPDPLPPVADFEADAQSITEGDSVGFTDLSTETPTSWLWDFGDGDTSTSQHPDHVYTEAGTYTVSLTATNAEGSDTETKSAYITVANDVTYVPPPPANALIEIYVTEPGSARWDEATWDDAVWSTAAWQDVTPQSVAAVIRWGSDEPYMGILSKPTAGSWSIDLYDPARLLDPGNADSPYFGDLLPGLPIRITHRGVVIRQGIVEGMSHSYRDDTGFIRVQDNIAPLANAMVPDDVDLGDTLYARAAAAIAAAGLSIVVLPVPPSGDPALVPWVTGTEQSAWAWIRDAAESVLHIPYIDRLGRLGFRAWETPLARARDLTATEMIDLQSIVQYQGLFSVVRALDDDGITVVERASTPPPRYGARTYERDSATPNVEDWLELVLADRVSTGLRWVPGQVYPLTADSVEKYATIEAVELISLSHLYTEPEIAADIIIVGGEITLTAKKDDEALWRFRFEAAETPSVPLITEDGAGFVVSEAGDVFLYPE